MEMPQDPYYSIVVTSRNDSHGGNVGKRMRLFVLGLMHQCRKYKLPIELIMVEWNPPQDHSPLSEALPKPGPEDYLSMRYIIVPPAVHQRFRFHKEMGLFQMIAKNVGIRRARGQFILASNIDLLFSDALMALLAQQNLDPKAYYRANRNDIPDAIDESMTFEAQMAYAEQHIIRRNGWDSRYKYVNAHRHGIKELGPISRKITDMIAYRHRARQQPVDRAYYLLDLDACGDFTMMHRDAWLAIQGYVELDMYSLHIDSIGVAAAYALGYRQVSLPREACTYHIDHPAGWSGLGAVEQLRFLEARPSIDASTLEKVAMHLIREKCPLGFNPPDWGYAQEEFEEIVFAGGHG